MRFRSIIFGAIVILVLLALGGFAWTWRPAIAPIAVSDRPSADEQTYRHGAELALIGDCNVCHVGDSSKAYAGGQSIPTPFGTIFATNITPDTETGIGGWSEAALHRPSASRKQQSFNSPFRSVSLCPARALVRGIQL